MKRALLILSGLLVIALPAAACGDDDEAGGQAAIRMNSGLAVAAAGAAHDPMRASDGLAPEGEDAAADPGSGMVIGREFGLGFWAPFQQSQAGITVQGYGSATADPDSAVLELFFSSERGGVPIPFPGGEGAAPGATGGAEPGTRDIAVPAAPPGQGGAFQEQVEPITEATLQPVIDALVAAGVPRDGIQLVNSYYDIYYASATLRAALPSVDAVDAAVQAAQNAAAGITGATLTGTNVAYTVNDCAALERAAMEAAAGDAQTRAGVLAEVLGVGLGGIAGASHYSYAPHGGSPCESGAGGVFPLGGAPYFENQPRQVELFANITVTYGIQ
jgi:uncharacterized protein YggE